MFGMVPNPFKFFLLCPLLYHWATVLLCTFLDYYLTISIAGHEVIRIVTEIGLKVNNFEVGDIAGMSYMAFSKNCNSNSEILPKACCLLQQQCSQWNHQIWWFLKQNNINENFAAKVPRNQLMASWYCSIAVLGHNCLLRVERHNPGHLAVMFGKVRWNESYG